MLIFVLQLIFVVPFVAILFVICREVHRCWAQRRANRRALAAILPDVKRPSGYDSVRHGFSHGGEYGFGRSMIAEFPRAGGGLRLVEMAAHSPDVPECP